MQSLAYFWVVVFHFMFIFIFIWTMISLNVQLGVNPLISHHPKRVYSHANCQLSFTSGDNGQLVAWRQNHPIFQMCPSVNVEADELQAITFGYVRQVDQFRQTIKIITLHNDNRLRIWAHDDGTCLNVSAPALFSEPIVALVSPPTQSKFLLAVAAECIYVVDCWTLKIVGKLVPKKESYARFRGGAISQKGILQLWDGNNRAYNIDLNPLLDQHFLDFGAYINDFQQISSQVEKICEQIAKVQTKTFYKRLQAAQPTNLQLYKQILQKIRGESLASIIFCPDVLKDYPSLSSHFQGEQASISGLHFIGGTSLYLFIGTESGKLFAVPVSTRTSEPIMIIKDERRCGSAVRYIRVFGSSLFVSWEQGWLGVYSTQNLTSHLEVVKINQKLDQSPSKEGQVVTADLSRLIILQERLSSFMKYSLPAYHNEEGLLQGSHFFRLDRNEVIRFEQGINKISHFRGIAEDVKIYCIFLIAQYVAVCTAKGVQIYGALHHERTISYDQWIWEDYPFLTTPPQDFQYRHSDMRTEICNANGLIKYNSRWVFDKLDYYSDGEGILSETFGDTSKLTNAEFSQYYFLQRGEVQKALHSRSTDSYSMVIKMKLNRVRKDSWNNAAFILHGNLNHELDAFQTQRGTPQQVLNRQFQFYLLLPWADITVPFLSKQMRTIGRRVCLRRRQTVQGVGKTFTIHFEGASRLKLSERILSHQAVACVALLQCWVLKDVEVTDHMVEAVQFFARFSSSLFSESGDIVLAKLAVSPSHNISKASINLIISKAISGRFQMSPIFQYFLLNLKKKRQLLSFNETVWLVFLGLGSIFTRNAILKQHLRLLVNRFLSVMQDITNYQKKSYYLLAVMRVFNEGVSKWRPFLENGQNTRLLIQLLRIFFYYDGLSSVPPDDKKFNFCFAKTDDTQRRAMKQGIVKSVIYLGKEFPQQFHAVLKDEACNQKVHYAYPSSVIEVLRQFIKSERPQTHLVFYVQLLLQCLSPMTPQLRKYVQRNTLNTLQLLCTYSNVAFNQPSQKLSVKTQNHLYIYCLRTSTKWRTINLKDQKPHANQAQVQMSPKGTYIALLSDKLRVWRLSSGFWSGVLGAFSQDWIFDVSGKSLKWDENEESITVINDNAALNKVFKI